MEHDLKQKISEFVAKVEEVIPLDRIDNLVGLLNGEGRYRLERLREIPGAADLRRSQPRHNVEQRVDVSVGDHGRRIIGRAGPLIKKAGARPAFEEDV